MLHSMKGLMKKIRFYFIFLMAFIWLAACQSSLAATPLGSNQQPMHPIDANAINTQVTVYPLETPIPVTTVLPVEIQSFDSSVEAIILQAKKDLNQKTGVNLEKITVLAVEAVEWSDSSLGCPQPDMAYLQVITPGYRILLEVDARVYEYHSNSDTYVIYCENPNPLIPPPKP